MTATILGALAWELVKNYNARLMDNAAQINLNADYWEQRYRDHHTGWDLGKVSNPIKSYIDQLNDLNIKILIPGAGNAHEAEYLIRKGFKNVYVADFSETALMNLKTRLPEFPSSQLIEKDFFTLDETFDLILEQTFFCAIAPTLRHSYARKMKALLANNGTLAGVLFDVPLNEDQPPFGGEKSEYRKLFAPLFNIKVMEPCYNSEPPRDGKELFVVLQNQQ